MHMHIFLMSLFLRLSERSLRWMGFESSGTNDSQTINHLSLLLPLESVSQEDLRALKGAQ